MNDVERDESPLDRFPHVYSEETDVPRHLQVRAEGLPLGQAIWSGLGYLRKYRQARWTAPTEEIHYFDEQRRLLRHLRTLPAQGLRLAMVGDIMWLRDSWDSFLSSQVLKYLNGHEAVIGNLESPISTRMPVPGLFPDYFTFNSDPRLLTSFRRDSGASTFSALATANNHCLDRGDEGLGDTLAFLDSLKIPHAGVRRSGTDRSWVAFEVGGVRFGFYAACWGLNNPAAIRDSAWHIEVLEGLVPKVRPPVDLSRIRAALTEMAQERIDFRIVSLHWGHEFEFYPLPELMQVGREIIRAGADVIMGTHPHVVQPLEVCFVNGYEQTMLREGIDLPALHTRTGCILRDDSGIPRKGLIAYSLGNFATAMYTLHCRTGLILGLHLDRNDQTGRVDWNHPEIQFVYNVHRDRATGRRRLVLLENYLRECERHQDRARSLRDYAAFLERHMLGDPTSP